MKRLKLVLLSIAVIFLFGGCTSSSNFKYISLNEYKEMITNKESFVLEVMKTDCVYCEKLKPKLEKVAKEYNIEIKVINSQKLSDDEKKELIKLVGDIGTPTIIFYNNGEEKSTATRINGNVSSEKLIEKFKDNGIIK